MELELKLKTYETESSLQISQTELALSRLTSLRSQITQLQCSNESMEEFLARFKSSGKVSILQIMHLILSFHYQVDEPTLTM